MSATVPDGHGGPSDDQTLLTEEPRGDEAPAEEPLSDDEVYHLLQARRRRLVLRYLRGREGPQSMRDVAEQVAAWEHDTTVAALRSAERQRVYIALYQTHLPKLDEAGVIEYEQSRGIVEVTDRIDRLYAVLDFETDPGATRSGALGRSRVRNPLDFYGGASLASAGLVGAAFVGLVALPGLVLATAVTALFALLTVGLTMGE